MINIINYFYLEKIENQSKYGVIERNYYKKNEYYLRCIINFFNSSIRYNRNCINWMITNDIARLNKICDIDLVSFCKKHNIKIIEKKSKNVVPSEKWAGSMYFFDAVEIFREKNLKDDKYIFFDNDIFFNQDIDKILNRKFDYLVYDITHEYFDGEKWNDFNGIKIEEQKEGFIPYGGEIFGIQGDKIKDFIEEYENIKSKEKNLKTEEHYISIILGNMKRKDNLNIIHANDYIKRCWTTLKYKNINEEDQYKAIIHVPSEKEYGIYWYSKKIKNPMEFENNEILSICGITKRRMKFKIKLITKKIYKKYINK